MKLNGNLAFLGGGQLQTMRIDNLAADPATPHIGQMWFNTAENNAKFFNGTETLQFAIGGDLDSYLRLDGGTMTGLLTLSGDPTENLHSATKQYVDNQIGTASTDIQAELDNTQTNAGLEANGDYTANAATNYLAAATSLKNADELLDAQVKVNSDAITTNGTAITDLQNTKVNRAGDTLTGNLAFGGTNSVIGLRDPVNANEAATKGYVDEVVAGLDFQADVWSKQVDATLAPELIAGRRYILTDVANLHADFGTIADVENNDIVEYDGTVFNVSYDVSVAGPGAIAWNRDAGYFELYNGTNWSEFGGLSGVTAGSGLAKEGNTVFVNFGAGIMETPEDQVGIDLRPDSGLWLTENGTDPSIGENSQLAVRIDGTTLTLGVDGIKVGPNGITENEINSSIAGNGLTGGNGTVLSAVGFTGINVDENGISFDEAYGDGRYINIAGDTMTGMLTLVGDPADVNDAANKNYVDTNVTALNTSISDLTTRMEAGYFVYDGVVASDTHIVVHNIGQMFCNVQVVDENNEVIIPQSIVFDSANQLTVSFGVAVTCKVVVGGIKAAA